MRHKILLILLLVAASAANAKPKAPRPYGIGYNFEVATDSLPVQDDDPIIAIDSLRTHSLRRGQTLVLARFQRVSTDTVGTVWVQVGTYIPADSTGDEPSVELVWLRENELLEAAIPDKIVSKIMHAIGLRSHLWYVVTLGLLVFLVMARYLQRHPDVGQSPRDSIQVMLLDRIDTPYPALLTVCVAAATLATRCADAGVWTDFYYSPTLNPLVPDDTIISLVLGMLWFTLIVLLATLSEIFRLLPATRAWAYTASLPCVCTLVVWLLTRV